MILLLLSLFGPCLSQNITLPALQRAIHNSSLIDEQFVGTVNSLDFLPPSHEFEDVCSVFHRENNVMAVLRCMMFMGHRCQIHEILNFLFERLCKVGVQSRYELIGTRNVTVMSEISERLKSLFWKIDREEDNNFKTTWDRFLKDAHNEDNLTQHQQQSHALVKLIEDEFWTYAYFQFKIEDSFFYYEFPFETNNDLYQWGWEKLKSRE